MARFIGDSNIVDGVMLRDYLQVKNRLNLLILDKVRADDCEFAFPTTTLDMPKS